MRRRVYVCSEWVSVLGLDRCELGVSRHGWQVVVITSAEKFGPGLKSRTRTMSRFRDGCIIVDIRDS